MEGIEFYTSPDGNVYYRKDGKSKRLTRFSDEIIQPLITIIRNRFPECYARLATIYKENASKMVDRFIRCNFGEHDLLTPDLENDILNFEEVHCPLRGICADERIVCKPQSLVKLSKCERQIVRLYLNGYTFKDIASKLGKNSDTVKSQLLHIRDKLHVKNCREIIKVMRLGGYLL